MSSALLTALGTAAYLGLAIWIARATGFNRLHEDEIQQVHTDLPDNVQDINAKAVPVSTSPSRKH